jgi:hypothetical protein
MNMLASRATIKSIGCKTLIWRVTLANARRGETKAHQHVQGDVGEHQPSQKNTTYGKIKPVSYFRMKI